MVFLVEDILKCPEAASLKAARCVKLVVGNRLDGKIGDI
jgi:hypothetical protein